LHVIICGAGLQTEPQRGGRQAPSIDQAAVQKRIRKKLWTKKKSGTAPGRSALLLKR